MEDKLRAPRNRTVTVNDADRQTLHQLILRLDGPANADQLLDRTVCQDLFEAIPYLPTGFVDLLVIDPPYNLDKSFNGTDFKRKSDGAYTEWVETWFGPLLKVLKPNASVYVCCDWRCSSSIQAVAERHLLLQNRITWEREKGRGALTNWKNCSEDIWFLTASSTYTFNVDAVKLKRRVIAPYTDSNGKPKDWNRTEDGDFRLTHPSNLWTDISIPFWSMPENTDHPTQKPEKLVAKLVLASSNPGDVVLDPFLGSGTTSVVCKKLKRHFVGIEIDETYCCLAEKRLSLAGDDPSIQGYQNGVFWDRNTLGAQRKMVKTSEADSRAQRNLFFGPETSQ